MQVNSEETESEERAEDAGRDGQQDLPGMEKSEAEAKPEEEETKTIFEWPFTQGEGVLEMEVFKITKLPKFADEEKDPVGKILVAIMSELTMVKNSMLELYKEKQKIEFEEWLAKQGKTLRKPGIETVGTFPPSK
jgi:hypothetical protein